MPKKILVVDDDPDIQDVCRTILESAGYRVTSAASAQDGEQRIRSERPDLVILDVMMEAADSGFELASRLGREHPDLPVIILSSIADEAGRAFDTSVLRVSAMVNKPVAPGELLRQVARLLPAGCKQK